jgi:nitrate/nitrite-specific signal transduction histidine kinase
VSEAAPRKLGSVKHLTRLYVAALTTVACTALAGQALVQASLRDQASDAHIVNIAGRQRMLSQRLAKAVLAMTLPDDPMTRDARRKEIETTAALWLRCQQGLVFGDAELALPKNDSPTVARMFADLDETQRAMLTAARETSGEATPQEIARAGADLLRNEPRFLEGMDRIVFEYDLEARQRVRRLSQMELMLLATTLVVLLVEGLFVFRPAAGGLRTSIENLWDTEDQLRCEKAKVERLLAAAAATAREGPFAPRVFLSRIAPKG